VEFLTSHGDGFEERRFSRNSVQYSTHKECCGTVRLLDRSAVWTAHPGNPHEVRVGKLSKPELAGS
jgi:hypothetical protein